jgi:hypothetical protein
VARHPAARFGAREKHSWMVGKPEVILGLDLFGGQVVNAFYFASDYRKLTHHPAAT